MVRVQIYFRNHNVAPLYLGGVQVQNGDAVEIDASPDQCDWNGHDNFRLSAGKFVGSARQPGAYQITQADDTGLVFTSNSQTPNVTYRPG